MFERMVIGVDPGLASTGIAAVGMTGRRHEIAWADTIRTPAGQPEAIRLRTLYRAVSEAISAWDPQALALERLMWGRNVGSAMSVARASGVVMLAGSEHDLDVSEYAPLEVKMAVTGDGAARKEDVRRSLSRLWSLVDVPTQPDAADAVAVAICHLSQSRALRPATGAVR